MECFKVGFGWGGRRGRHEAFVFHSDVEVRDLGPPMNPPFLHR